MYGLEWRTVYFLHEHMDTYLTIKIWFSHIDSLTCSVCILLIMSQRIAEDDSHWFRVSLGLFISCWWRLNRLLMTSPISTWSKYCNASIWKVIYLTCINLFTAIFMACHVRKCDVWNRLCHDGNQLFLKIVVFHVISWDFDDYGYKAISTQTSKS